MLFIKIMDFRRLLEQAEYLNLEKLNHAKKNIIRNSQSQVILRQEQ